MADLSGVIGVHLEVRYEVSSTNLLKPSNSLYEFSLRIGLNYKWHTFIMMKRVWGLHTVINAGNCNPYAIRSKDTIFNFTNTLVKKIDMKAYGSPQIIHFGEGNKAGYTLVQLIETSNICAHFVEESNDMYLDVFSCKDFEQKTVEEVVQLFFSPEKMDTYRFIRCPPVME